jgi:hypothetical protein
VSPEHARRWLSVLAAAGCLATLAACTSSKQAAAGSGTPPAGLSATDAPPTASDIASDTASATPSTSPATSSSAATSTAARSSATGRPGDACTMAQLTVRVLRGSAAQQQQFALVTLTNKSSKPCTLFGYPGVSLRRAGALLGAPAERDTTKKPAIVTLRPGEQAESLVTDFSACQAPLSDTMRVYPPNLTQFADRPVTTLRGCRMVVEPMTHS